MFKRLVLTALLAGAATLGTATAASAVSVTYYSGYTEGAGGLTFSGPYDPHNISAFNSAVDPDFPGGAVSFGANLTGTIDVASTGNYTFDYGSDDADYVFIDGTLEGSEPGPHGYYGSSFTELLTAGFHSVDFQYYNSFCCGASLNLDLPAGVTLVPEPADWTLLLVGFGILGATARVANRRRLSVTAS